MNAKQRLSSRKPSVQTRPTACPHRSAGFTLVEILVVIVIIGILMAIAVPAIFSAVSTAKSTAMKMELNSLEQAVEKYQEKYGDYPPDFSNWAMVKRHYRKIFPRISFTSGLAGAGSRIGDLDRLLLLTTGYNDIGLNHVTYPKNVNINFIEQQFNPTLLDRGMVLPWVLGGYSSDPQFPFTGPGGPLEKIGGSSRYQVNISRENSLFDFNPSKLGLALKKFDGGKWIEKDGPIAVNHHYQAVFRPYDTLNQLNGCDPPEPLDQVNLFPSYAASNRGGTPFVYFNNASYGIQSKMLNRCETEIVKGFSGFYRGDSTGAVRPYASNLRNTDGSWGFMRPNGFQIIAPGIDDNFGFLSKTEGTTSSGGPNSAVYFQFPTGKAVNVDLRLTPKVFLRDDVARYQEPASYNKVDNFQQDNLTNFADGKLIDELQE